MTAASLIGLLPGLVAIVEKLEKAPHVVPERVAVARCTRIWPMPDSASVPEFQFTETASRLVTPSAYWIEPPEGAVVSTRTIVVTVATLPTLSVPVSVYA